MLIDVVRVNGSGSSLAGIAAGTTVGEAGTVEVASTATTLSVRIELPTL